VPPPPSTSTASCRLVTSFVEGQLDVADAAEFRRHLAGCESCRRAAVDGFQLSAHLGDLLGRR